MLEEKYPPIGVWVLAWDRKHEWRDRPPIVGVKWNGQQFVDKDGFSYGNLVWWKAMPTADDFLNNPTEDVYLIPTCKDGTEYQ